MFDFLRARLSPFRHREFRNFFLAQSLSMIGAWSHDLARSWIVVEATGSSGTLGNLNTAVAVPGLFLMLQAGVLVDRTDVRKLIQYTKSLLGLLSLALAALFEFSQLEIWHLFVFALIEGIIVSYDSPAFQALTVRLVPRSDFQQAIALNSTNFHTSRMLGPIVAAWLMSFYGPSLVFLFDGLSYFLVALVLARVKPFERTVKSSVPTGQALKEGLHYLWSQLHLRYRLIQLMVTLSLVFPLMISVFRVYVQKKFALDAQQFGTVFTFPALGSMTGALSFAFVKPANPIRALYFGIPMVFLTLLLLPTLPSLSWTVATMSLTGFSLYLTFASLTISMQLDVEESFRGRMSSVIALGFFSIGPLMSFPLGHLADALGPEPTIKICALLFGGVSALLALANRTAKR